MKDNLAKYGEINRYIKNNNEDLKQELSEHYISCEYKNKLVRLNVAHYKTKYCDESSYAESSAREQSLLNFVLEKQ